MTPTTPIIVLTDGSNGLEHLTTNSQITSIIKKPVDFKNIDNVIENLCEKDLELIPQFADKLPEGS